MLFDHLDIAAPPSLSDLAAYTPRLAPHFKPDRIILAKGGQSDGHRRAFVDRIIALYPQAEVIDAPDTPHSQIDVPGPTLLQRQQYGKRTLVLGELKSAVRFSQEQNNTCPNYWHVSPYGYCPYNCRYCYLAGTIGVKFSPTVKVFVNLPDMLARIDHIANRQNVPTAFYVGKLQDALALDPLTGYSRILVPFFARHRHARLTMLTKSGDVANLLDLDHKGHTILSWSLNPESICRRFESNTPPLAQRLSAMEACSRAGYPLRAVIMPLIPVDNWQAAYGRLLDELLARVRLDRITLGGICSYRIARALMNAHLRADNTINRHMADASADGRIRYPTPLRIEMYRHLCDHIRRRRPDLAIALCLEERDVWQSLNLMNNLGQCNCVV